MKNWVFKLLLFICVILMGAYLYYSYGTNSAQAKRCVNGYLEEIQRGGTSTLDFLHHEMYREWAESGDFINVFEYKFLREMQRTQEPKHITFKKFNDPDNPDSLLTIKDEEDLEFHKKFYTNDGQNPEHIISEDAKEIVFYNGENDVFLLYYDLTLANGLGQKVYKRALFEVVGQSKNLFESNYKIRKISLN